MATETRKIAFSFEEVYQAIALLAQKTGRVIPDNPVSEISDVLGQFQVTFGPRNIRISDKEMLTALLLFCRNSKIPVPKNARKSVSIDQDFIILQMRYA